MYKPARDQVSGQPVRKWIDANYLADPFTTLQKPCRSTIKVESGLRTDTCAPSGDDSHQLLPAPNLATIDLRKKTTLPGPMHNQPDGILRGLTNQRYDRLETLVPDGLSPPNPRTSPNTPRKLRRKRTFERITELLSPSKSPKRSPGQVDFSPVAKSFNWSQEGTCLTGYGTGRILTTPGHDDRRKTSAGPTWAAILVADIDTIKNRGKRKHISFIKSIEMGRSSEAAHDDGGSSIPFNGMLRAPTKLFGPTPGHQSSRQSISKESFADQTIKYKIYLFEKILLCVKDLNLKSKSKTMGMTKSNEKKNKPRLALKGRIYICNVTDTLYLSKPSDRK